MLVRRNNKILTNSNLVCVNNEINSLQVVNTSAFRFQFMSTGPITVYWGDGTNTQYLASPSSYIGAAKTYSTTGSYNIIISNPQNVTALYFYYGSPWYGDKINTNVSWFRQFYNLTRLEWTNTTFTGELGNVINTYLIKLNYLSIAVYSLTYATFTLNVSNCKYFWTIATYIYIYSNYNNLSGNLTDININLSCTYISLNVHSINVVGSVNGIIKNGYTALTSILLYTYTSSLTSIINIDDLIIPSTLTQFGNIRGIAQSHGNLINFDFKNITNYNTEGTYSSIDLTNNTSFINQANKFTNFILAYLGSCYTKINLSLFSSNSFYWFCINTNYNYNLCYGDITNILNHTTSTVWISGGKNDNSIYGTLDTNSTLYYIILSYIGVTATSTNLKTLFNRTTLMGINFLSLNNFTGDLSGSNFAANYSTIYGIQISTCPNLTADITTFTYNSTFYSSTYCTIDFSYNVGFTGNLANLTLWSNKQYIKLNNSNYSGIPGLYRNIFTNRNTCLKAAGGMTYLYTQGNTDNSSLTGTYQQPNLGTYLGNINDLTETQITNLSNGLDYTGTGTNTAWTDKEKIWILTTLKNSSTDSSLRYRFSTTY